jgi:hypothetical protein
VAGSLENETTVDHPGNAVVKTLTLSLDAREPQEMIALIRDAVSFGATFFDTAEIYGPKTNEELIGEAFEKLGFSLPQQPEGDHSSGISGMSDHIRVDGQNFALTSEVASLLSSEPTRVPSHIDIGDEPGIPIHACLTRIADHVSQKRGSLRVCCRWQPIGCCRDGDHSPFGSKYEPTLRLSSPRFGDLAGISQLHSQ